MPSSGSPPRVFDIADDTKVQQPIRNIDHELRSARASLQPARPSPAIEPDEEETSGEPDEYHFGSDEELTDDPAGQDFDEALDQIASEGCCVCLLCGAIWRMVPR